MHVYDYLARIGFQGEPRPDVATLAALQRAHLLAIPFENLDVQLGRSVDTKPEAAFDKLVTRRRGGWCYEMNGLFGWALGEIGFDVMRMAAGVMREAAGDGQLGNHLCLLVRLDQPYLVDVGFGGSLTAPLLLAEGAARDDAPFAVSLSAADNGYWRFGEILHGAPFSFDFRPIPADEALLANKCVWQQSDAASPFVQNLVARRRADGGRHLTLRGRVFTQNTSAGAEKTLLRSADELVATLRDAFSLDVPEAETLWPAVCARHEVLFGENAL